MIPMRIRIFFSTLIHNLFSYTFQFLELMYDEIVDFLLTIFSDLFEELYSFFYSHNKAFEMKVQDKRQRTTYVKDGYGRRHKIVTPATRKFYPHQFIPVLRRYLR